MDTRVYIYYVFLALCFIISLFHYKNEPGLKIICLLLFLSVVIEAVVFIFKVWHINKANHYVLYHIFTPIEYALIASYYYVCSTSRVIRKALVASIFLFCTVSPLISFHVIEVANYPSLNNQISYALTICFSMMVLLSIKPNANVRLTTNAVFWIATGFTIYCTGIFFFNSLYNYLKERNPTLAKDNFHLINSIFNDILYTLIAIGYLCSRIKRYKP